MFSWCFTSTSAIIWYQPEGVRLPWKVWVNRPASAHNTAQPAWTLREILCVHDDVIKRKHFLRYWPFVRGIHRSPVNSPHKGQVTRSFYFFFDLRLNKRLNKHWWGWWFQAPSRSLWRHSNGVCVCGGGGGVVYVLRTKPLDSPLSTTSMSVEDP